jgi:hypothetical protein
VAVEKPFSQEIRKNEIASGSPQTTFSIFLSISISDLSVLSGKQTLFNSPALFSAL